MAGWIAAVIKEVMGGISTSAKLIGQNAAAQQITPGDTGLRTELAPRQAPSNIAAQPGASGDLLAAFDQMRDISLDEDAQLGRRPLRGPELEARLADLMNRRNY
jgi:hypothetical protein